tara:strand:- start:575 stop:988 length:414 start_codon:yes stop_codon:yes gene_type:complete
MPFKNKEDAKAWNRKYYQLHKEKKAVYNKLQYEANKENIKASHEANKENMAAQYQAKKDGYYTVYYLKEEHYAGMTSNLNYRLKNHKNNHNRYVEDVEIIGKYQTKEGALRVEAALHSMGYNGRNPQHKQQTLKEVL